MRASLKESPKSLCRRFMSFKTNLRVRLFIQAFFDLAARELSAGLVANQ
jgi:hypothetical protein